MNPHYRLDKQIEEASGGRLTYDTRRRLLVGHNPDGSVRHELEISETALRGLMQRLLLATPEPLADEPIAAAVQLLLAHLDETS